MPKLPSHYALKREIEIAEIQCTLRELEHTPTGAHILHIANDDEENLFNLSFRTWPETSNGVAHILEHTVLCGSKHFPVRDPFFAMNRRSLNTFMNALTGADFTCYPAASQVEKDFYNLFEVYLDAVFHPKLDHLSFLQEGHRLEFLEEDDPNSPLLFKGIVFNEMKGALATGEARLSEALMEALYPDLTYGINSGGEPKVIPSLSYEELKAFHAKYYHPSRCLFFFYGNLPLEKHLDFLDTHAFKGVKKLPPLGVLPPQPRFTQKVEHNKRYPISEEEDQEAKTLIGLGWLTCSILEQEELLALSVLDIVLMGTDAGPLKKALLKSGLCKQTDSVIDGEMSEIPFLLICKGCDGENADALEKTVQKTLAEIVEKGLPPHLVEGAIHQLEMARTEITGNSSPYGLHLFFRAALLKQHGGNPEDGLRVHSLFANLRKNVEDPRYLPNLIQKQLIDNPHCVRIVMEPSATLGGEEVEEEQAILEEMVGALTDPQVKEILEQSKALSVEQDRVENLDVLPKVTLNDVAKSGKEFSLQRESFNSIELFYHPCFTNEMLYADLIFDLPAIAQEDLPFLRLFTVLLPQIGCGGRPYAEHLDYLLEHTGGVGCALDLGLQVDNPAHMRPSISLRGKALYRKLDTFFPILRDLMLSADFTDEERLKELLMQHFHALENSIQHSSLRYAVNLASRGLSVPSTIINAWYGLDYFESVKQIVTDFEANPRPLIDKMQQLQTECLALEGTNLVLSCDQPCIEKLKREGFYGLADFPTKPFTPWTGAYTIPETHSQGRLTASPVAFTTQLFPSLNYTNPQAAALSIASEVMENKVLHKRIREQGGAYGAGAVNGLLSGQFYFYAYRDPHLKSSLEAFREGIEAIVAEKFEGADVEEAKLGLFQDLDSPTPPGSRSLTAYGRWRGGRTPEVRQHFREHLLQATKEEIAEAAKEHLLSKIDHATVVTFAGKELLEKENALLQKPLPLYPI